MTPQKRRACVALLLLVPVPSLGVWFGMILFPNSFLGLSVFAASKVWLFTLPLVWRFLVERQPLSLSPPRQGGFRVGLLSGLAISAVMVGAYFLLRHRLFDTEYFVRQLTAVGLAVPSTYLGAAIYWILVNSVLEEYVWRWFCVRQCEFLMRPPAAVLCSALFFTLHHSVAMSVYFPAPAVGMASAAIMIGGAIWSGMYLRYRSIWPGYLSHAIADACIFGLGAAMLFAG